MKNTARVMIMAYILVHSLCVNWAGHVKAWLFTLWASLVNQTTLNFFFYIGAGNSRPNIKEKSDLVHETIYGRAWSLTSSSMYDGSNCS